MRRPVGPAPEHRSRPRWRAAGVIALSQALRPDLDARAVEHRKLVERAASRRSSVRLVATILLAATSPMLAQVNTLPNGDFSSGIAEWVYSGDPAGTLAWEPTDGSPDAGSLRLTASAPGGLFEARPSSCADVSVGETWAAEAEIKRVPSTGASVFCDLQMLIFSGPGCTGLESGVEPVASGGQPGVWTSAAQANVPAAEFGESVSVRLLLGHIQPGEASCLFDSVRLYRSPAGVEIPAASSFGLAVLALLVATAGVALLRRHVAERS